MWGLMEAPQPQPLHEAGPVVGEVAGLPEGPPLQVTEEVGGGSAEGLLHLAQVHLHQLG